MSYKKNTLFGRRKKPLKMSFSLSLYSRAYNIYDRVNGGVHVVSV